MQYSEALKERAAGKWQIPLLGISLIMLAASLYSLRPGIPDLPFAEAVQHLDSLVSQGFYQRAINLGDALLVREELTDADLAPVYLHLARAHYGMVGKRGAPNESAGSQIIERYREAAQYDQPLTAADFKIMGRAFEWQERFSDAVDHYNLAVEKGVDHAVDLRKHVVSIRLDRFDLSPESSYAMLEQFLVGLGDQRLDLRLWAIERQLDLLGEQARLDEAATLLTRQRERFRTSVLADRFQYLEALVLYKTGHYDDAEVSLRTIRNRIERGDEVDAMTGWLLGRVVLSDDGPKRPQEALSFFHDVIKYHSSGPYVVASQIGSAEALAILERHGEALGFYRAAIDELDSLVDPGPVDRDVLRASLGVAAEAQRQAGSFSEAVEYARLSAALIDRGDVEQATLFLQQLAQLEFLFASQLNGQVDGAGGLLLQSPDAVSDEGRRAFATAASSYMEIAHLNALNETNSADASWWAAELYARAGERDRAVNLYRAFATERPQHPLVPRALLRIGQLRRASRRLAEAVEVYQECYRRFPRTLEGSRVLGPLARCYLSMGPSFEELAEKTLRIVLEDSEVFTPEAPEFADAMFLLGEVLSRRGHFERAIAVLEETIERYPSDPRTQEARFRLANAHRRSGLALKDETGAANSPAEIERMRARAEERFQAARQLYRQLIRDFESRGQEALSRLERVYSRHAFMYEADCYFEMQQYTEALKLYEQATGMFRETPSSLAAYVQIINSNVFLGRPEEARAALARVLVLVEAIPREAFENSVSSETRDDWKRYFNWLAKAEVF